MLFKQVLKNLENHLTRLSPPNKTHQPHVARPQAPKAALPPAGMVEMFGGAVSLEFKR